MLFRVNVLSYTFNSGINIAIPELEYPMESMFAIADELTYYQIPPIICQIEC